MAGHFDPNPFNDGEEVNPFVVQTFGFLPLEREKSASLFTGLDYFGSGTLAKEDTEKLARMESATANETFVIIFDIWLDNEETMAKVETMLDAYEVVPVVPSLFVLMGNFCSQPFNLAYNSFPSIRSNFGKLGQMIGSHHRLMENSRFLFIPWPNDGGP